ncbi:hypothetical protein LMH73_020880 [Vibrio splendidus]|nr:hypothetical protein [Vibrio splendidus]MCC4880355.1 hypothetical protein [Vibrio splendidus]
MNHKTALPGTTEIHYGWANETDKESVKFSCFLLGTTSKLTVFLSKNFAEVSDMPGKIWFESPKDITSTLTSVRNAALSFT